LHPIEDEKFISSSNNGGGGEGKTRVACG